MANQMLHPNTILEIETIKVEFKDTIKLVLKLVIECPETVEKFYELFPVLPLRGSHFKYFLMYFFQCVSFHIF